MNREPIHPQCKVNLSIHIPQCTYPPTIHSEPIHTQSIVNLSTHIPQWINLSTHIPQWTYPPTVILSTHKPIHPQPTVNLSTHDPEHLPYRQSLWWLMTWRSVLKVKHWQLSETKTHNWNKPTVQQPRLSLKQVCRQHRSVQTLRMIRDLQL